MVLHGQLQLVFNKFCLENEFMIRTRWVMVVFLVYKTISTNFEIRKLHQPGTVEKAWERLCVFWIHSTPKNKQRASPRLQ